MCKIFLAVILLAFGAPLDGGAAMLIAARASFAISRAKRWTNPYVTDGLIAMWDAEWNAGPGVHDVSAGWVDIIGGRNFTFVGTPTFGDKSVTFNAGSNYAHTQLTAATVALISGGYTDEMLILNKPTYSSSTLNGVFGISKSGVLTPSGLTSCNIRSTNGNVGNASINPYNLVTLRNQGEGGSLYISSNAANTKTFNGYSIKSADTTATGITINRRESYSGYGLAKLVVGCRRIYSRVITAAEMSANYAIDKARFNLS